MVTTDDLPDLSVVIPHYNDPVRLRLCLSELLLNNVGAAEIIVVDNASTVPLDDVIGDFPSVRFFTETEKGAAPARNRGVAESQAPVLAFIDADCVPDRDWLDVVRKVAPRADLTGGRVSVFDETPPPRSGAEAFETVFAFDFKTYVEKKGFSGAGNLVTTRAVFDDVGPFINGVAEDAEWTMRAVAKGYRLAYADELRVRHPSRQDWSALQRKWNRMTKEAFALAGDSAQARLRWAFKALMMPISVVVHLPRILFSPELRGPKERWRGAVTLVRIRLERMRWMLLLAMGGTI